MKRHRELSVTSFVFGDEVHDFGDDGISSYALSIPIDEAMCVVKHASRFAFDPPTGGSAVINVPVSFRRK